MSRRHACHPQSGSPHPNLAPPTPRLPDSRGAMIHRHVKRHSAWPLSDAFTRESPAEWGRPQQSYPLPSLSFDPSKSHLKILLIRVFGTPYTGFSKPDIGLGIPARGFNFIWVKFLIRISLLIRASAFPMRIRIPMCVWIPIRIRTVRMPIRTSLMRMGTPYAYEQSVFV